MQEVFEAASSAPLHPESFSRQGKVSFRYQGSVCDFTVISIFQYKPGDSRSSTITLSRLKDYSSEASHDDTMSPKKKEPTLTFTTRQLLAKDYRYTPPSGGVPPYSQRDWFDELIFYPNLKDKQIPPKLTNGKICEDLIKYGITFDLEREVLSANDVFEVHNESELPLYVWARSCIMYFT